MVALPGRAETSTYMFPPTPEMAAASRVRCVIARHVNVEFMETYARIFLVVCVFRLFVLHLAVLSTTKLSASLSNTTSRPSRAKIIYYYLSSKLYCILLSCSLKCMIFFFFQKNDIFLRRRFDSTNVTLSHLPYDLRVSLAHEQPLPLPEGLPFGMSIADYDHVFLFVCCRQREILLLFAGNFRFENNNNNNFWFNRCYIIFKGYERRRHKLRYSFAENDATGENKKKTNLVLLS